MNRKLCASNTEKIISCRKMPWCGRPSGKLTDRIRLWSKRPSTRLWLVESKLSPSIFPAAESVFKNPRESGLSAWQVLDKLGLRGHRIGAAQIAEKHSNFIINHGGATAADVRALIDLAKNRARDELGIALHEEVIFVG